MLKCILYILIFCTIMFFSCKKCATCISKDEKNTTINNAEYCGKKKKIIDVWCQAFIKDAESHGYFAKCTYQ